MQKLSQISNRYYSTILFFNLKGASIPTNKVYRVWRGIETIGYILCAMLLRIDTNSGMRQLSLWVVTPGELL